jgi:hypothetical protein
MDDVLGHVVLTVGDEDLGAEQRTIALLGTAAHRGQVGTGRSVHGAGWPLTTGRWLSARRHVSSASMAPSVSMGHSANAGCVQHFGARGGDEFHDRYCRMDHVPATLCKLACLKPGVVSPRRFASWSPAQFSGATTSWQNLADSSSTVCPAHRPSAWPASLQVGHGKQHVFDGGGVTHGKAFQVRTQMFINSIANRQSIEGCMSFAFIGGPASTTPAASLSALTSSGTAVNRSASSP